MQSLEVGKVGRCASPFLKWAGGKSQLLKELDLHVPKFDRYFEPFLGGGALFFYLSSCSPPFRAYLSDVNNDLIETYRVVKSDVEGLISRLRRHEIAYAKDRETFYYRLRDSQPNLRIDRAARLIALNKTCYNGLYRVNRRGTFNVPMGRYKNPSICNESVLRNASFSLKKTRATFKACDYFSALDQAGKDDFVYLDPPFVPLSKTASFVNYVQGGFSTADQIELAQVYARLHKKGCKVLLSNSDTMLTRKLYSGFDQFSVRVSRAINCRGDGRTGFTELLVRNYAP